MKSLLTEKNDWIEGFAGFEMFASFIDVIIPDDN